MATRSVSVTSSEFRHSRSGSPMARPLSPIDDQSSILNAYNSDFVNKTKPTDITTTATTVSAISSQNPTRISSPNIVEGGSSSKAIPEGRSASTNVVSTNKTDALASRTRSSSTSTVLGLKNTHMSAILSNI